jgi:hypothetical protein
MKFWLTIEKEKTSETKHELDEATKRLESLEALNISLMQWKTKFEQELELHVKTKEQLEQTLKQHSAILV